MNGKNYVNAMFRSFAPDAAAENARDVYDPADDDIKETAYFNDFSWYVLQYTPSLTEVVISKHYLSRPQKELSLFAKSAFIKDVNTSNN